MCDLCGMATDLTRSGSTLSGCLYAHHVTRVGHQPLWMSTFQILQPISYTMNARIGPQPLCNSCGRQSKANKRQVLQRAVQKLHRSELSRCFYLWKDRFGEVDDYARKRRKVDLPPFDCQVWLLFLPEGAACWRLSSMLVTKADCCLL